MSDIFDALQKFSSENPDGISSPDPVIDSVQSGCGYVSRRKARAQLRRGAHAGSGNASILDFQTSDLAGMQFNLEDLKAALQRRWRLLVAVVFGVLLLAGLPLFLIVRPTYEPVARVVIDPPGAETFSLDGTIPNPEATDYLETQAAILKSDTLAIAVIRKLDLVHNPEYQTKELTSTKPRQGLDTANPSHPENVVLKIFQKKLTVALFRNSRLVEVRYAAHDPELAARVANTLVNLFVDQTYETRFAAITKSSDWLTRQLDDIRRKVEQSNQALADYESKIGFLDVDDKHDDILSDKLSDLNHQFTEAQAERIQLAAYLNALREGDIDSVPELRNNDLFRNVTEDYLQARADLVEESAVFGTKSPHIRKLQSRVTQLKTSLIDGIEASYRSAKSRELMMRETLDKMKSSINDQNEARVRLNVLKREASANAELYNTLFTKIRETGIAAASKSSNARVVDYARVLETPTRPNKFLYLALALLLGLAGGLMLVLVTEAFDTTVRDEHDVITWTGLPAIGVVPTVKELVSWRSKLPSPLKPKLLRTRSITPQVTFAAMKPSSAESEAVRNLRTNILLATRTSAARVILVTSASAREGKTTVAANLAITLATRARTCLIDADLRRPSLAKLFGLSGSHGLKDILQGHASPNADLMASGIEHLELLVAGEPADDAAELLSSRQLERTINKLSQRFDYVVIDSAPILPFSDARILSTLVDGVVLIGRWGSTTRNNLQAATSALQELGAPLLGIVINGMSSTPHYYNEYNNSVSA